MDRNSHDGIFPRQTAETRIAYSEIDSLKVTGRLNRLAQYSVKLRRELGNNGMREDSTAKCEIHSGSWRTRVAHYL